MLRELEQTAVYVTHDQDEAFSLADVVGVMHQGELLRLGEPPQVWRDPQSEVVARFLGHEAIIEMDGRRFAVRPDAIVLSDSQGDYDGVVRACAFQGDRYELLVDVNGQAWRFFHDDAISPGTPVQLMLDPTKLASLVSPI